MATLRDALTEALSQSETGELQAPVETPIESAELEAPQETAQERADRLRDERGRFVAGEKEEPKPVEVQPVVEAPVIEAKKPPSSWAKAYWDKWGALPPDVQEYIEKRESDYAKGVSTYKAQWDQAAPIYEAIQPFMPELQQHGLQPAQWIANLGNAHRTLALGSPEQKLQMFAKLATDYGVPLQALTGQPVDPQFGHITQTVQQLQSKLQQFETLQQQQEQARVQQEIEAFKANAPHFDAVRETMSQLLQSGVATDLQTAYDKALRLNDDIWQQQQAEQAKAAEAARQAELAKKKAAAVSPKSTSPTGSMAAGNTKKGLRDLLSDSFESVSTGRF